MTTTFNQQNQNVHGTQNNGCTGIQWIAVKERVPDTDRKVLLKNEQIKEHFAKRIDQSPNQFLILPILHINLESLSKDIILEGISCYRFQI